MPNPIIILFFLLMQAVFIGMMISSFLWGNIADKYGRKTVSSNTASVWYGDDLYFCFLWNRLYLEFMKFSFWVSEWKKVIDIRLCTVCSPNELYQITIIYLAACYVLIVCTHRVSRWVYCGLCSMAWWVHLHLSTAGSSSSAHWWALALEEHHSRE